MEQLYTVKTLAELLQVSPSTIRRELDEGRINWFKVRGQIRFKESDVKRYINHRQLRLNRFKPGKVVYLPLGRQKPAQNE